jgi:Protein of unknown function (DUF3433)
MTQISSSRKTPILVDYTSMSDITSLFRSLKNNERSIIFVALGGLLIKLLIAASTCLLAMQTTASPALSNNGSLITVKETFNARGFNTQYTNGIPAMSALDAIVSGSDIQGVINTIPAAYPTFTINSTNQNESSSTDSIFSLGFPLDAFVPSLSCDTVESKFVTVETRTCFNSTSNSTIPFCQRSSNVSIALSGCDSILKTSIPLGGQNQNVSFTSRLGDVGILQCGNDSTTSTRFLAFTGFTQTTQDVTLKTKLLNQTTLTCQLSYAINKLNSVMTNSSGYITAYNLDQGSSRQLSGLSTADFANSVFKSLNATSNQITKSRFPSLNSTNPYSWPEALSLFTLPALHPVLVFAAFMLPSGDFSNPGDLTSAFQKAFSNVGVHLARESLMSPSNQSSPATNPTHSHIVVRQIPLRIMEACSGLLILSSIVLLFTVPKKVVSRDPSTIGGLATILAQSSEATNSFRGLAISSKKKIRRLVGHSSYSTTSDGNPKSFTLHHEGGDSQPSMSKEGSGTHRRVWWNHNQGQEKLKGRAEIVYGTPKIWWNPLPSLLRIIIVVLGILCIVALEALHQLSKKHTGLTDISSASDLPFVATFISAILLIALAGCFGFIDFYTRLLQPYHQLKKYPSTASRSILLNYLSQLTPVTIWTSASYKHLAVFLTASTSLIAPILVIIVGGLFFAESFQSFQISGIKVTTSFDSTKVTDLTQGSFPFITSFALGDQAIYPTWTYGSYAFPQLQLQGNSFNSSPNPSPGGTPITLQLTTTAMKANLSCTLIPNDQVITYHEPTQSNSTVLARRFAIPLPNSCGSSCKNSSFINTCGKSETYFYDLDTSQEDPGASGGLLYARASHIQSNTSTAMSANECPQFSVLYGQNSKDGKSMDSFTAMNCFPMIYQVQVSVTYDMSTWAVFNITEVMPNNSSIYADNLRAIVDPNVLLPLSAIKNSTLDPWFGAILSSSNLSLDALASTNAMSNISFALSDIYGRLTAQNFHVNRRSAAPSQTPTLTGTITGPIRIRLMQDTWITRALEVLIACMVLMTAASYLLLDPRKLLPNNPCSVAVMASLIADSELVKREMVPIGSEWCNDEELRVHGIFDGYMFRLGMWDVSGIPQKVFGINVGNADKVE